MTVSSYGALGTGDEELIRTMLICYGEDKEKLIREALQFLADREPMWKLDRPVDKREYLEDVIWRALKGKNL